MCLNRRSQYLNSLAGKARYNSMEGVVKSTYKVIFKGSEKDQFLPWFMTSGALT